MSEDDRRRASPASANDQYRQLFEESRDAIYIGTTDGRLIDINPAGVQLFGFDTREEMLSLDIAEDLYWNPEDRKRNHAIFIAQGYIDDREIELKARDGSRLRVRETSSAIYDDNGEITGFRGILRDVTEQRRLEEQLRQSQKMEAVGRLAEGVAHDFNNLLTAINGYSELLLLQIEEDNSMYTGLSEIRKAGKRAAELTRRLLTFSRHQIVSPRRLDLNRVVAEMEKLLNRVLGEHIELETLLDPEGCFLYADPSQIEQVILNLAINARDAMVDGGRLTLETSHSVAQAPSEADSGHSVELVVRDTGQGIDDELREHIFEPFFTTKESTHNTGLGLSIVYGIVQQNNGRIDVESDPGAGTTVRVTFPAPETSVVTGSLATDDTASALPRGHETVLLVEDEAAVRDLVQRILALQGYRVLTAANARRAIEICDQLERCPDLLLTDVVMPETSGTTLAEELQGRFQDLKVIFMSGYTDSHLGLRLLNSQRAAFIAKPFSPESLAHKVRSVLDDSHNT